MKAIGILGLLLCASLTAGEVPGLPKKITGLLITDVISRLPFTATIAEPTGCVKSEIGNHINYKCSAAEAKLTVQGLGSDYKFKKMFARFFTYQGQPYREFRWDGEYTETTAGVELRSKVRFVAYYTVGSAERMLGSLMLEDFGVSRAFQGAGEF